MNPLYVWGTSMEIVTKIFLIGGLIFIAGSALMISIYRSFDEKKKKEEKLSFIVTILFFGSAFLIFTYTQARAVGNRGGYLQIYEDHLVLEDNNGNARAYDYDEIESVSLNKEMIIANTRNLLDYATSIDNRDQVEVQLVNGKKDFQGYEYNNRFTTRFVERLNVQTAKQALEGKVAYIRANEEENRQLTEN
jgi:hypothetical protein